MERDLIPKILRWAIDLKKKNQRIVGVSMFGVQNSCSSVVHLGLLDPKKEGITIDRKVAW
jgi:hypothetical protein